MKHPDSPAVVAFFVRVPVPGRVKTRLAASLGAAGACTLYQAMVTDILRAIRTSALPLYLFHDGPEDISLPQFWVAASVEVQAQQGEQIGTRMAAAFAHCFAAGIDQVILVGSDIPGLDSGVIKKAAAALASHDAVLVPVADGGYCLIALQRAGYHPRLFADIPWSTDQVLRITLQRFKESGLDVSLLPRLQDIDTIEDLKAYWHQPASRATATNRVIKRALGRIGITT